MIAFIKKGEKEDHEGELIDLWHEQWIECESKLTGVLYVNQLGYIED